MDNNHHIEEWRDIPGYKGAYQVSSCACIRSLDRIDAIGRQIKGRILHNTPDTHGYLHVRLCRNSTEITYKVARLVLLAFRGPPKLGQETCHSDGNRKNDKLANLQWRTSAENAADRKKRGTAYHPHGERNGAAKLTTANVHIIRSVIAGTPHHVFARRFGVSESQISRIRAGKHWRH